MEDGEEERLGPEASACAGLSGSADRWQQQQQVMVKGRSEKSLDDERKARIRFRRKLGPLKDLVVAPKTRLRYSARVAQFLGELEERGVTLTSLRVLDEELEQAVGDMWWRGDPKGWAADLLSGVQHFVPWSRKKLVAAWRLYGAWNRRELPSRAPPMDRRLLMALAGWFWRRGRRRIAVLLLVGVHCYVRTGELLAMRKGHIAIGPSGLGVVSLGETKGRRVEMVTIDDRVVGRWLKEVLAEVAPGERVVDVTEAEFRALFQRGLEELGVAAMRYKPYSLRRGGGPLPTSGGTARWTGRSSEDGGRAPRRRGSTSSRVSRWGCGCSGSRWWSSA